MVSGVKSHNSNTSHVSTQRKMAEQIMREAIAKDVAEATRVAIQAMAETQVQRMPSTTGPKLGGPVLKQPNFNWEATDKYTEWKAFILEVRNMLSTYNAKETIQNCNGEELVREEKASLY